MFPTRMGDPTKPRLAMQMPNPRPLSMGKEDLRQMAAMLLHRVGRDYDHTPHLLDQAVLAHLREDEQYEHLKAWTRAQTIEAIPKNLRSKIDLDEFEEPVEAEMAAQGTLFEAMTQHMDGQIMLLTLTRWALSAYATVQMPRTYAEGLIATTLTKEIAYEIRPPFIGMMIELPDGLLSIDNADGGPLPLRRVLLTKAFNRKINMEGWAYIAMTDEPMSFWRYGITPEAMLGVENWHHDIPNNPTNNPFAQPVTDRDARVSNCLGRLILNTCLAMADPDNVKKTGPGHRAHETARRRHEPNPPLDSTYVVGRPLKHDVREAVRAYVEEGREHRHLNVQTLVAGHWRSQAYGEDRLLRKRIWVEPYWRGPEDAPIVQRPHVLLGKTKEES